jgi:hypothetical protein
VCRRISGMRTIALALATGALLSVGAVALAGGGPPPADRGYPPPGVTAIGFATVPVAASNTETEIRRAVERANERARPRAFNDARGRAEELAAIAGMRVGAVWAVSQDPDIPYPGSGVNQGTFGANDFCGRTRKRWECRAPKEVTVYLTVTFAQG